MYPLYNERDLLLLERCNFVVYFFYNSTTQAMLDAIIIVHTKHLKNNGHLCPLGRARFSNVTVHVYHARNITIDFNFLFLTNTYLGAMGI